MAKFNTVRIVHLFILLTIAFCSIQLSAATAYKFNLLIAPGTVSENEVTLLWDKQYAAVNPAYVISLNDKVVGNTTKTNYTASNLTPNTWYTAKISIQSVKDKKLNTLSTVRFKTRAKGKIYNVLDYGAKADSTLNTKAIQSAIDACTPGGTVYIPKGTFISGALHLKSNMTLYIEEGGVLKGSTKVDDYLPMILNRFEGWEMKTYASLLNAGTLNRNGTYNVKNLRINGKGTISGGGKKLGDAMTKASGIRSRGRLICLMNSENVSLSNLSITEPPCWTIHYIYSNNITCNNLKITTVNIRNGDGIDPDSSTNSYIFNCTFDTGDDCIAIKSGKNPEGFFVAKPTRNVRITDCDFKRGHGISIGSEMSGGVSDVLVQDCKAGKLLYGMQIKGTKDRGGYVRNVTVADCQLLQITIFSAVNYNNDGEAAPQIPTFENFVFKNIDLSLAPLEKPAIDINGFKDPAHLLRNVSFTNIVVAENAKVKVNDAQKINFTNVKSAAGNRPVYVLNNTSEVVY
ncbi:glycoside hydrolase family 28 protein [Pedobacter frigiditerrae]|uniref:Glycoside hydrolase family 28 protein n=1 Tax=Pedobacter frigiditerrae TaxID=2530452 RepID=A0A4R0MXQ8_9SPHI|nr:glycoside hydrolase family 28 protein [Pedobacter frigiditerrae]TCC92045.1 glycoside hydrolase family 28 protein [Pedobacter frigiditerrae]